MTPIGLRTLSSDLPQVLACTPASDLCSAHGLLRRVSNGGAHGAVLRQTERTPPSRPAPLGLEGSDKGEYRTDSACTERRCGDIGSL